MRTIQTVKGMTNMNNRTINIPNYMYDERIYSYAESLIDEGFLSYHAISTSDKEHFITLIIDVLGEEAYQILIGSDNLDKTLHLFAKYLKSKSKIDSENFISALRENALDYYDYYLQNLFDEVLSRQQRRIA